MHARWKNTIVLNDETTRHGIRWVLELPKGASVPEHLQSQSHGEQHVEKTNYNIVPA
jgi:hypothetical protein